MGSFLTKLTGQPTVVIDSKSQGAPVQFFHGTTMETLLVRNLALLQRITTGPAGADPMGCGRLV